MSAIVAVYHRDALPVTSGAGSTLLALPAYPQLKLAATEQPGTRAPERLGVTAVCLLHRATPAVNFPRLRPRNAMLALIGHTMAARLFDRSLLDAHLAFCRRAAESVPVFSLSYPRNLQGSRGVGQCLVDWLPASALRAPPPGMLAIP